MWIRNFILKRNKHKLKMWIYSYEKKRSEIDWNTRSVHRPNRNNKQQIKLPFVPNRLRPSRVAWFVSAKRPAHVLGRLGGKETTVLRFPMRYFNYLDDAEAHRVVDGFLWLLLLQWVRLTLLRRHFHLLETNRPLADWTLPKHRERIRDRSDRNLARRTVWYSAASRVSSISFSISSSLSNSFIFFNDSVPCFRLLTTFAWTWANSNSCV